MRVYFDNKGIEMVNLPRLLHKVNDAIPNSFVFQDPPTVFFLRSPTIGSKIFNYKKVVEGLETKTWNADDLTCECSNSKLCDPDHGHIVTGNLNVITNNKLRSLLTKGPKYRESNKVDWKKVFHCIKRGVCEMQHVWCTSKQVDGSVLNEWSSRLLHEVKLQIRAIKKRPSFRFRSKSEKILDNDEVKAYLSKLHEKYVIWQ